MARKLSYFLIFISLCAEMPGMTFSGHWSTFLQPICDFMFRGLIGPLIPWDMAIIGIIVATRGSRKRRVKPMDKAILASMGGLILIWVWGAARGGNSYQGIWQIHHFIVGALLIAWMVMNTTRTRADVRTLGNVVLFACVYRAFILFVFRIFIYDTLPWELPYMTDHTDSVLFVTGIYIAVANALERPSFNRTLGTICVIAVMVTAIVLNNRRIAWLDVAVGALLLYVCMPPGKMKKKVTRTLIYCSPMLIPYVAIGWGHPTGIFKPVGSISSMFGQHQDMSSIMRDIENYNLVRTLQTNIFFGAGWGHQYIEEVVAIDNSSIFPLYRFMPHNSFLGLIAFTGIIGFGLTWQVVVLAVYFNGLVLRGGSTDPTLRAAALWGVVAMATVMVQYWGDVGFFHLGCNTMLGVALGAAGRLAAIDGVWPGTARSQPVEQAAAGVPAQAASQPS